MVDLAVETVQARYNYASSSTVLHELDALARKKTRIR